MIEEILTFEEVRKYLKISKSKLYQLTQQKKIPVTKIGRTWRFKLSKIDAWLNGNKQEGLTANLIDKASLEIPEIGLNTPGLSLRTKLKLYKRRADKIEQYLSKKPEEWGKFQSELNSEVNDIFRDIMNFEKINFSNNNEEKLYKLKGIFINKIRKLFLKGAYNEWSLRKPLGYAGDFKIIDDIYQNTPYTTGIERLFDNYFMMSAISEAVRNRKEDFKHLIIGFINSCKNRPLRIMNLACGPCREIKEIFESNKLINKDIIFDCYDHEKKALEYAKGLLNGFKKINFIHKNILKLSTTKNIDSYIKERYDFIYSAGFFDYLGHRMSVRLVKNLRNILNKDGFLVISNVRDKYSNPSVHYMEWVGEWNLVYRSDEEFKKIFLDARFKEDDLKIQYEQQGIMQYIIACNTVKNIK